MRSLTYQGVPLWRHHRVIQWASQFVSGILVVGLVAWFFINIASAIEDRNIPFGFSFLSREYLTPIGQHFLPYESSDSYLYALFVGFSNTVLVSIIGGILATILGVVVGVGRLSSNWLVAKITLAYIEFFRNVPLLVQLFFWFYIMLSLPALSESYILWESVYINNRGISAPAPAVANGGAALLWLLLAAASVAAGWLVQRTLTRMQTDSDRLTHPALFGFIAALALIIVSWFIAGVAMGGPPLSVSFPAPQGNFGQIAGGITAPTGLTALLIGLVMYTASFIAEIVRAGIQSVNKGQIEAARALGLHYFSALRHVTFPQAMRVIIPLMISQYLNLAKNSSLAGAIGYADLTNVAKTMTQTAPAISIFVLIMLGYLAISLTYSLVGNLYNAYVGRTARG